MKDQAYERPIAHPENDSDRPNASEADGIKASEADGSKAAAAPKTPPKWNSLNGIINKAN
jgi:hypothetical protein